MIGAGIDLAALVLCVVFLAYVVTILVPFLRRRPEPPGDPTAFDWHLILPCLDEEVVIARTIARLRADHPLAHLWCVDDDSSDATGAIIAGIAAADDQVHLVSRRPPEARQGKGAALNAAWRRIRAWTAQHGAGRDPAQVVVGVVDADGRLAPDALTAISGPGGFGDPAIGAVQIQVRMMNRGIAGRPDADDPAAATRLGRLLVTLQDLEFRTVIAAMQDLRHRIGSAGMGGNGQFTRLVTLDRIASENRTPWHGALLEDFELGLHVLFAGWRTRYLDDTWVAQEGLPAAGALVRQRARWSQGGMQCARYFKRVLLARTISTPSALEISYFLLIPWTQLLGTLVYTASACILGAWALGDPRGVGGWFAAGAWGLVPLVALFGLGPLVVWGFVYRLRCEPRLTRRAALGLGLAYWLYTYLMLASVWRGFYRVLRARHGWVKTSRVLEQPRAALPSTAPDDLPASGATPVRDHHPTTC
jgi:cellulose synthase/poly-beta-1,6-N-acetylglucosamine synthase-like glycosyltransferase